MKKIIISIIVSLIFVTGIQAQNDGTSTVTNTGTTGDYVPTSQDGFVRFVPIDGAVQIIAQENNSVFTDVQCVEILPTNNRTFHRVLLSDGRMQLVNEDELVNLCGGLELIDASSITATDTTLYCHLISEYLPTIDPDYYRVILTDETTKVIHKSMLPSCTMLV